MSLHYGFTGTQDGGTKAQQTRLRSLLECEGVTHLHHGDCIGADKQANDVANLCGIAVILHPPNIDTKRAWCTQGVVETRAPRPYLERNHDIVDESVKLIVVPSGPEKLRSGTWATYRYARKLGPMALWRWCSDCLGTHPHRTH